MYYYLLYQYFVNRTEAQLFYIIVYTIDYVNKHFIDSNCVYLSFQILKMRHWRVNRMSLLGIDKLVMNILFIFVFYSFFSFYWRKFSVKWKNEKAEQIASNAIIYDLCNLRSNPKSSLNINSTWLGASVIIISTILMMMFNLGFSHFIISTCFGSNG